MRRIKVDLIFEESTEADEVWAKLKDYLKTKKIINLVKEKSYIDYHECFHGVTPEKPCVNIEYFEKG